MCFLRSSGPYSGTRDFPEPGTGVYTVDFRDLAVCLVQLTLTDVSGRMIESRNLDE